jgi:HAD superfamily hydrolase (TIGR01458 family)
MKAALFDLDGVLYEGSQPIPGAAEAIDWFQKSGMPYLFLTNTTSRPRTALVEKLNGMGIHVDEDRILTPPVAAVTWLQANVQGNVALFVPDATQQEFAALSVLGNDSDEMKSGGAVVVGDLGAGWDFSTLNRAFRLLVSREDHHLVALGMTRYWRAEDGLRLDAGPFVSALAYASGKQPVVLGKPSSDFYRTALQLLGGDQPVKPESVVMIGDDIKGDIDGAQQAGIKGVLVKTGKFNNMDLERGVTPYAVIESVSDLPLWWQKHSNVA